MAQSRTEYVPSSCFFMHSYRRLAASENGTVSISRCSAIPRDHRSGSISFVPSSPLGVFERRQWMDAEAHWYLNGLCQRP